MKRRGFEDANASFFESFTRRSPSIDPEQASGKTQRLLSVGLGCIPDHELLEVALAITLQSAEVKPIAQLLLRRFGSFAEVISAPDAELRAAANLDDRQLIVLRLIQVAALRLGEREFSDRPILGDWSRLLNYLNAVLARERSEHFRVLFLDTRNRLIADERLSIGTINHASVYPREVMKRALELGATAMILVHNHPSGDPSPSTSDILMTREIRVAAASLDIALHDHIIIGREGYTSLRREGMIE